MVGLSIIDIISSVFGNILSTWPMPKGQHLFAVGSVATCDAFGFLGVLTCVATPLYSCSLATYYLVQLRYNWSDSRIKALEKWFHIVPWTVGLISAIIGLALNLYGPTAHNCLISLRPYPLGCELPETTYECTRGNAVPSFIMFAFIYLVIILSIFYVAVVMFQVYKGVNSIERKSERYSFVRYTAATKKKKKMDMSQRVMIQGLLYTLALILIFLFPLIGIIMVLVTGKSVVVVDFLIVTFYPLQGFFNALIYSFPAFQQTFMRRRKLRQQDATERMITAENTDQVGRRVSLPASFPIPSQSPQQAGAQRQFPNDDKIKATTYDKHQKKLGVEREETQKEFNHETSLLALTNNREIHYEEEKEEIGHTFNSGPVKDQGSLSMYSQEWQVDDNNEGDETIEQNQERQTNSSLYAPDETEPAARSRENALRRNDDARYSNDLHRKKIPKRYSL